MSVTTEESLLPELVRRCAASGFDLVGAALAEDFDSSQPAGRRARDLDPRCGTLVVLATAARDAWERLHAHVPLPLAAEPGARAARGAARALGELCGWLADRSVRARAVQAHGMPPLNLSQLAELSGLGIVSPVIGQLLHPVYGPWVALHAALLVQGRPFGTRFPRAVDATFQPCTTCAAPCAAACPGETYADRQRADLRRCAQHRHQGHCASHCDVRRACPLGAEHRFPGEEEARRQAVQWARFRRFYGFGPWRMLPVRLRQGPWAGGPPPRS